MTKSEALGPLSSLVWGSGVPGLIGMSVKTVVLRSTGSILAKAPCRSPRHDKLEPTSICWGQDTAPGSR